MSIDEIADLHKAIKNRNCIYLEYIFKKSRSARIFHPHKLVFKQSYWYLYAFCENNHEFRLFKINRIANCKIMMDMLIGRVLIFVQKSILQKRIIF